MGNADGSFDRGIEGNEVGCLLEGPTVGLVGTDVGFIVTGCIDGWIEGTEGSGVGSLRVGVTVGRDGTFVSLMGWFVGNFLGIMEYVGGVVGVLEILRVGNAVGCCFVGVRVGLEGTLVGFGEGMDVG